MKKEVLAYFPFQQWPLVGLLIFLTVFIGVVIWVYRKNSGKIYEYVSRIPLHDENRGIAHPSPGAQK